MESSSFFLLWWPYLCGVLASLTLGAFLEERLNGRQCCDVVPLRQKEEKSCA